MRIRIAQKAWAGLGPSTSIEETFTGVDVPWIEIDGVRYDTCVRASVEDLGVGASGRVKLELLAVAQLVYLDRAGNELPWPDPVVLNG